MTAPDLPSDGESMLLPEQWTALEPMVDALLDAASGDRASLLDELSEGDAARRALLQSMVADCERELPAIERPAEEQFGQLLQPDDDVQLPELLGERYRIEREIGRGGMARVYLAHDLKHGRSVAVKVIRPDLAASLGRERFLREIGIAARLRHPNIVPLYDSGDTQGQLFFVMPYESGQSLRERLDRSRPLPAAEYVSVLRDIARALAYAHAEGVVHRDVKPDNVMLSGGAAVVTDFGIAKAMSVAQGVTGNTTTLTQTGSGIGTPTYMAPEQAIGDPSIDHRADLYAFGCVAYELISGAPPFHNMTTHQLVAAHVATVPTPLATVQPDVPDAIARMVMRCLEKDPADRPQTAQELVDGLETPATTGASSSVTAAQPRRRPSSVMLTAGALVVGLAGYTAWQFRRPEAPAAVPDITVAVLPMESVGGDSLQRELADGLSDEVATALVHEQGVRVMSRRGVGNYRGQRDLDYEKAGKELGAHYLVTGELRVLNGRSTIGATLHDASDGSILWKESYVQQQQSALDVLRDSIAHGIAEVLRAKLGVVVSRYVVRRSRSVNPEAYRLYVLGQRALDRRGQSIQASVQNFERAIAIDSTYAEALAGLSLAKALSPFFSDVSTDSVAPSVRKSASLALKIDSTLAPAHVALGLVHQHAFQWDSAAAEYQLAIKLRSAGDVEPLLQYGRHLLFRGRPRDALQQLMLARQTEPASALVSSWVSYAFYLDGKLDSALVESERAYQSDSNNLTTLTLGALVRLGSGRRAEARRFALRITAYFAGMYVLSALGDTAVTNARLRAADLKVPKLWFVESARAYAMLGARDTAGALSALERATDRHEFWPAFQPVSDPLYSAVWKSPRFQVLLRRVGLGDIPLPAAR